MKVYICYDRYENDEWFNVEYIGTDKDESIRKVRDEILPEFLNYGPDDCHSFQLQVLDLTKEQYEQLLEWDKDNDQSTLENYGDESSDYFKFMCEVYESMSYDDCLIFTDGCSDYSEIVKYYGKMKGLDPDDIDEDMEYDLQEEIGNMDSDEFFEIVKKYVYENY